MRQRDVFVSGMGLVSPAGAGVRENWASLAAGELHVSPVQGPDLADCRSPFAAQVRDFRAPSGTESWDRLSQLAAAAADEALADADWQPGDLRGYPASRSRVCVSSSKGNLADLARLTGSAGRAASKAKPEAAILRHSTPDVACCRLAGRYGIDGGLHVPVAACATGLTAIIRAGQLIRDDDADLDLCGGRDASVRPLWLAAFDCVGVLAQAPPQRGPS
jgi:3-oxoacyl-[acyl-carrier-protein] synthase II